MYSMQMLCANFERRWDGSCVQSACIHNSMKGPGQYGGRHF